MSAVTERPVGASPKRGLGLLLASTGVSVTGDGMLLAAAPLMAAALSRDPLAVASVSAAGYAAWLLVGLPAGALVDRWDRRTVMVASDLGRAAVLVAFVLLVLSDNGSIAALAVAVFLVGIGSCFFDPAAQALIPAIVGRDKERLSHANGRLWAIDTFGRSLAGPPVGAAAFAAGRVLPFGLDASSFLLSAALVSRLPTLSNKPANQHEPMLRAIRIGMAHLVRHPELRTVTLGMASYNLGYNIAFATLVLYAQDVLNLGTVGFGLLIGSGALGGIAGGWIAPRIAAASTARSAYAITLGVQAAAWLAVLLAANPWIAAVALAFVGVASTTGSVVGGSTRQLHTPDDMLGRVVSSTRLFGIGSAALGSILGGVVADAGGLGAPFIVAAGLLALASLAFLPLHGAR
ncbi:MFS transporter [Micromonospora aurantiaca]|uniref:MFS transporter n=1 Tax=Micromonospora aurantiaca (nom. illeg.) TaxID=47850 RepID=UPI0037FAF5C5